MTLVDQLAALPKADILAHFKALALADGNPGIGFDPARASKGDVIARLCAGFSEGRILEQLGAAPVPAPVPTPAPIPAKVAKAAPVTGDGDAAAQLVAALRALTPSAPIDADQVRAIAQEVADGVITERAKEATDSLLNEFRKWKAESEANGAGNYRGIEVKLPTGDVRKVEGYARPELPLLVRRAAARVHQMIVGPAGSGKTFLGHQVAEALGLDFASISCTTGTDESHLLGTLIPTGEAGRFEFHDAPFLKCYEQGGVFLFDEIDAADPNVLLVVNQALANGSMFVAKRIGKQRVNRHPDFVCIAAANTWGTGANAMHTGRERLDEATLDRFRRGRIEVDFDREFERANCPAELLTWAEKVRAGIQRSGLRRVLSTRFLLDSARLIATGETLADTVHAFFLGWSADEKNKVGA